MKWVILKLEEPFIESKENNVKSPLTDKTCFVLNLENHKLIG